MDQSEGFLGHNVIEIFTGDLSSICRGSLKHFLQLLNIHCLTKFFGHSPDVSRVDMSTMIIVEEFEYFINAILS